MDSNRLRKLTRVLIIVQCMVIFLCHNFALEACIIVAITLIVAACNLIAAHKSQDKAAMKQSIFLLAGYIALVIIVLIFMKSIT